MILWLLLTYGITLVITGSSIFRPVRQMDPTGLLKCPMCTGWWVGMALTFCNLGPAFTGIHPFVGIEPVLGANIGQLLPTMLANAFSASAWCWIVHVVLTRLGADKL